MSAKRVGRLRRQDQARVQRRRLDAHVGEHVDHRLLDVRGRSAWSGPACWSFSPQDQNTVPAPKTSAPLSARYMVRLWVTTAAPTVVP